MFKEDIIGIKQQSQLYRVVSFIGDNLYHIRLYRILIDMYMN